MGMGAVMMSKHMMLMHRTGDGVDEAVCPHTKAIVARVTYNPTDMHTPWVLTYDAFMAGIPGRRFKHLQAAQYAALAEYVNMG